MTEAASGKDGELPSPAGFRSLRSAAQTRWPYELALLVTVVCLVAGQNLVGVTIISLGIPPDHYSVFGGVFDLWAEGNRLLAVILFSFSVVFPALKCVALGWMWFRPMDPRKRASLGHWLKPLGKWSMLDMFVVAALVGAVQLRGPFIDLATANPEPAAYLFAGAILLSLVLSFWIARLADDESGDAHFIPQLDLSLVIAPWGAAICLGAALTQPIMRVSKKIFSHVYSSETAVDGLLKRHDEPLLVILVLFVVLLPLIYFLWLGIVALMQRAGRDVDRALSSLVMIERWAMVDVYCLGLLLVYFKIIGFAEAELLTGFWLILASAVLSIYCAMRVRRVY
jgi:paraquat-inducible protein A